MFVIGDVFDGKYSLVELDDTASGLSAEVCPERGALVCSLQWGEQELLYLDRASFEDEARNVRGGIPILFPICGPLANAEGPYRMPQHGLARQARWGQVGSGSDLCAWTELQFNADQATRQAYNHDFQLFFRFQVAGNSLLIRQSYQNRGSEPMGFQTGLHPYFRVDKSQKLEWEIPATQYWDNDRRQEGPQAFDGQVPVGQRSVDWEFPATERRATMTNGLGQRLTLRFSEHYTRVVVWSLKDDPFACLEPWSGPRFGLEQGENVLTCPPGQTLTTWVAIDVENV